MAAGQASGAQVVDWPDVDWPDFDGPFDESLKGTANPFVDIDGDPRTPGELAAAFAGWTVIPEYGFAYQFVDPHSSDPTILGAIMPPFSGHPTEWERFRFQFPHPAPERVTETALVIGFHGWSITELDIFANSSLPAECASRGYYLLAPLGLDQTNWMNTEAQASLDAILDLLQVFFEFNTDRIYAAGFSMGGGHALSYAMRRQDPSDLRIAGVINHTGTLDLIDNYNNVPAAQASMTTALGGTPVTARFHYERVSPLIGMGGVPDPDFTNVSNLLHLPIYYHVNLLDDDTVLLAQNAILKDWLVAQGANATFSEVLAPTPPKHSWSTMDMGAALDFVEGFTLPPLPTHIEFFADRTIPYLYTEPRVIAVDEVARYHVDVDTGANSFTYENTKNVDEIAFDLLPMGLDPTKSLSVDHETIDATSDTLVLKGYRTAPISVLTDGGAPSSWSHDALAEEVTVTPNGTGVLSTTVIGAPVPIADFTALVVSGVAPLSVDFSDDSWGCVTGYTWLFGDSGMSSDQNPTYIYTNPGTYNVTLLVSGPGGNDGETKNAFIQVLEPPPTPEFSADTVSGDAPLTVNFTDLTTGNVTDWDWDFGDTNTSMLQSPQNIYSTPGVYTVTLTATGPGGSQNETKTNYITVTDPTPVAEFSSDVSGGAAPQAVQFTDLSTGVVTTYAWDFGDTNMSSDPSPLHTYTASGTYTVALTVTGPGGMDTETKVDFITITDAPPIAEFSADVLSGNAPLVVQFTDESTGGVVTDWDWTFGDLGTSTSQNPQHTYTDPGTYTVILNAIGPGGNDLEVKSGYITVN